MTNTPQPEKSKLFWMVTTKVVAGLSVLSILVSIMLPEDTGAGVMMIGVFALAVSLMVGIGMSHTPTTVDTHQYDFSYIFHKTNFISWWSILITVGSLVWMLVSKLQDQSIETALAFFIGFLFLSVVELLTKWVKQNDLEGFTYSFDNHGVTIRKGNWEKELVWQNYKTFTTVYKARHGRILSQLPFFSIFIHESDKYTIVFNPTDEYRREQKENLSPFSVGSQEIPTDRIVTMPKNHRQVVEYISKYLPEKV